MTIQLPSELTWALSQIGIDFPDTDEDKLNEMGQAWQRFSNTLWQLADEADKHARAVWTGNEGDSIEAFKRSWSQAQAPLPNLRDGAEAARSIAKGLSICADIVTGFKLLVIAEAAAFALTCVGAGIAAWTGVGALFGAGAVIVRRIIAQKAIDTAIDQAIQKLLLNG
jgi:hypothetical protein